MTITPSTLSLSNLKPFIKWAGGRRALLPELLRLMPKDFNNYFEPFIGGGALFFELTKIGALNGKKAYLFDANAELINVYQIVKKHPKKLLKNLKEFQAKHSEEFYYITRAMDREPNFKSLPTEVRAARFIYLNKTCFNGLWRVNSKGYHNVPIGRYKNPTIYDEELIMAASIALQNAEIRHADFAKVLDYADKGDFVYFDPPYYPLNATSSFTEYHENAFLDEEQKRLYSVFKELADRGISVMHSNSDTEFIKELYKGYDIEFVEVNRFINSKSGGRGKIKEIAIINCKKGTQMTINDKIQRLALEYSVKLKTNIDERVADMQSDDKAHYLIYKVLGISAEDGELIDLYQNKGRFLYKYAGSFLEEATKLCFLEKFPKSGSSKVPNTEGVRPKTFEIDCLVNNEAFEIKWRDATTDGDHITKEHTRIKAIKQAGYKPMRIMFYYPNRAQAIKIQKTLETLYDGIGGEYYFGDAAWEYVKNKTGINLKLILEEIANKNFKA